MGKKLTDKEREDRDVRAVISKIQKLEKIHTQEIVERACAKYKVANVEKRRAEKSIAALEEKLADAKKKLR